MLCFSSASNLFLGLATVAYSACTFCHGPNSKLRHYPVLTMASPRPEHVIRWPKKSAASLVRLAALSALDAPELARRRLQAWEP